MKTGAVFLSWVILMMIVLTSVAFGQEQFKFCQQNGDCSAGECCVEEECTAFLSVGQRCNILTQILSLQCPCEIGSSCITTKCFNINQYLQQEIVENRDAVHIETNTIEE